MRRNCTISYLELDAAFHPHDADGTIRDIKQLGHNRLEKLGFDMARPYEAYNDPMNRCWIFTQEENPESPVDKP